MSAPKGNKNNQTHGGEGLKKRVEIGLTTQSDYQRYVTKLANWGTSPQDVEAMGVFGEHLTLTAWQAMIAEDMIGAYLWTKENTDDLQEIERMGTKAQYHCDKAKKGMPEIQEKLTAASGVLDYEKMIAAEER